MQKVSTLVSKDIGNYLTNRQTWSDFLYNVRSNTYGAKGDGATNDTAAIQAAIDDAHAAGGGTVGIPPGVYRVKDLMLKDRVSLFGAPASMKEYDDYTGQTGISVLKALSGYGHVLVAGTYVGTGNGTNGTDVECVVGWSLENLFIDGVDRSGNGISQGGQSFKIRNCKIMNCNLGYGGKLRASADPDCYTGQIGTIEDCYVTYCNVGVTRLVDSRVIDNYIYSCTSAVFLDNGNHQNTVALNKIEWCDTLIQGYNSYFNTIIGNTFDRGGKAGFDMDGCQHWAVTGNFIMRSGSVLPLDGSLDYLNCHFRLNNCINIQFSGNVTKALINDNPSASAIVPKYVIIGSTNTDIRFDGNDLSGFTTNLTNTSGNTNFVISETNNIGQRGIYSKVLGYAATNQSFTGGVETVIAYDTETVDVNGEWNATTYDFTALASGSYVVESCLQWTGALDGEWFELDVFKSLSGSGTWSRYRRLDYQFTGGAGAHISKGLTMVQLNAGDKIRITAQPQNTRSIVGGAAFSYFSILRMADTTAG